MIKEIAITSGFDSRPEIRGHYYVKDLNLPQSANFSDVTTTGLVVSYNIRFRPRISGNSISDMEPEVSIIYPTRSFSRVYFINYGYIGLLPFQPNQEVIPKIRFQIRNQHPKIA